MHFTLRPNPACVHYQEEVRAQTPPKDNSFEIEQRPRPNTHRPRIAVRAYHIRVSVAQQGSKEEEWGCGKKSCMCDHVMVGYAIISAP
jgi:hypothetical protein